MHRVRLPAPAVDQVLVGGFTEDDRYDVWRPAGTEDWLLLNTLEGAGRIGVAGHPDVITEPGDVVIIRPGVPHDYGTGPAPSSVGGRWSLQFAHFRPRPEWLAWLDWPQPAPGVVRVRTGGDARRRIREALQAADAFGRSDLRQATMFALNAVEAALLWCTTSDPGAGLLDPRVLAAMEDMAGRLAEPITVPELARRADLSASRFAHLFAEQVGVSPMRYLERQRMRLAEQLLDLTPRTVAEIARTVGYDDPLYFSRAFKRRHDEPPQAYRDGARGKSMHR
ncbi:MAG TPA: helix-turn-helix domain-containing protein [Microlunatus sp.]|nr:helix-turn-helix domain-containing protein [Microlunatus sp.]